MYKKNGFFNFNFKNKILLNFFFYYYYSLRLLMFGIIYVQSALIASAPSASCVSNCEMYQTFALVVSSRRLTSGALTTSGHTGKHITAAGCKVNERERVLFFHVQLKDLIYYTRGYNAFRVDSTTRSLKVIQ